MVSVAEDIAENKWWMLQILQRKCCAFWRGFVVYVAEDKWWIFQRICGAENMFVNVDGEIWWMLKRTYGGYYR